MNALEIIGTLLGTVVVVLVGTWIIVNKAVKDAEKESQIKRQLSAKKGLINPDRYPELP